MQPDPSRMYEIKLPVKDGICSTSQLALVHTSENGPYGGLVRTWSGHQSENGVNITITEHQFGPSIVLVTFGQHVICEFEIPIPQLKLSFSSHDKAERAHDYLEGWLKEHCRYALVVLNRDGPAVVTVDRAHEEMHGRIRGALSAAGMGFDEIDPPINKGQDVKVHPSQFQGTVL